MATLSYKGVTGSIVFHFTPDGDLKSCSADRYKGGGQEAKLEKWEVRTIEYGIMNGIRVPVKSEATRKLKEGDFTWFKLEVTGIEYNKPYLFTKR
jgi:hypothetical protein